MAGGQGERFWPMTGPHFPKYRMKAGGGQSLLRQTYQRLRAIFGRRVHVVTTGDHLAHVRAELPRLERANLIVEPSRNNTAAALYLSTALLERRFGREETLAFFPADHLIQNNNLFKKTVGSMLSVARNEDALVTAGIKPAFAATGYGYLRAGRPIRGHASAFAVARFVEKPDARKAKRYLRDGHFYWNAGIFAWKTGIFLEAMKKYSPEFASRFRLEDLAKTYKQLPNRSIDYALMEKADHIAMVRAEMDWCDVGNWDMMFEKSAKDASGSSVAGQALVRSCRQSLVWNQGHRPLVVFGVDNLIAVQTDQGTLVCPRGQAEAAALFFKKNAP